MEPPPDQRERWERPKAFDKMEGLVRQMQSEIRGKTNIFKNQSASVTGEQSDGKSEKHCCGKIVGAHIMEWLITNLQMQDTEAHKLAGQLCQYGYFFPISDNKSTLLSSCFWQSPYYWPWQNRPPDNVEYAIYLMKRTMRNKQRHALEDYEEEALGNLKRNLANKWDFITMQATEQVKLVKSLKKTDKVMHDAQERAYWRVHRPPPGVVSSMEQCPVPTKYRNGYRKKKRTIEDCKREVDLLKTSIPRTRVKTSQSLESLVHYVETYAEYDPMITSVLPSNPWVTEDITFWQLNSPIVDVLTEKRIKRWSLSMEELVADPTGIQEFTNYLRKEYSHENIRFWMAVRDLRRSSQSQIQRKISEIFEEFLAPGAPCEINIDGKTMERVHTEMKTPSRFTFDAAQEHVYTLLLKKDCYPRFIRSEHYKNLLANGYQPSQKKRFFGFGPVKKKSSTSSTPNPALLQQQTSTGTSAAGGTLSKRRGSDRSLSGSAHELAISAVKDTRVPHSHSQSNLSDIPYRGDLPCQSKGSIVPLPSPAEVVGEESEEPEPEPARDLRKPKVAVVACASTSEDVCPWESLAETRSRKNSSQIDSCSSSSDLSSTFVADVTERFRRTCGLTQQNTLDSDRSGKALRKLSASSFVEQRRASVSVPIRHHDITRPSSSFEENVAPVALTAPVSPTIPSETKVNARTDEQLVVTAKTTFKRSSMSKSGSIAGSNAPIISVSSVTDDPKMICIKDVVKETVEVPPPCSLPPLIEPDTTEISETDDGVVAQLELQEPIAGPSSSGGERKGNDVCPWEDEEACKEDAPYVKTYATLGYL